METLSSAMQNAAVWLLPLLALWLLVRCTRSMLREKYEPEIWAYLETPSGETAAIRHWECIIGRSKSCDIVIKRDSISRTHAVLVRNAKGAWKLYDLKSTGGTYKGKNADEGKGIVISSGDKLRFADVEMTFRSLSKAQLAAVDSRRSAPGRLISPAISLLILTVFQALLALRYSFVYEGDTLITVTLGFACLMAVQWCYYLIMRAMDRSGFEVETLAFFLSTLGIAVVATCTPGDMVKQMLLLIAGVLVFVFLGFWLRDLSRAKAMRWPAAVFALGFLALNLAIGITTNGAANWISIGGFTLQPSEFVKVAYVYVGAATLDRLFRSRNLFLFLAFSAICVGALALMGDFGTAVIFFGTFLIISFMRSGSFATVFLAVGSAVLAGFLVLTVKPYIARRFSTWGHIWEDPLGAGWQQTRALSAAASGGLVGVGPGKGWLKDIFAADTDVVFCLMCEELGLIIAMCAMVSIILLALFAVRNAAQGRSSFFVIAACACAGMMMIQLALNVFGSTDILPFTGVTFPFVSKGGSSLISCWGLLAFIKASDTRQGASFSVKRSAGRVAESGDDPDYFEDGGEA